MDLNSEILLTNKRVEELRTELAKAQKADGTWSSRRQNLFSDWEVELLQ